MKIVKLAIFGLLLGFGVKMDAGGRGSSYSVADAFYAAAPTSAHFKPEVCVFTNDRAASIWVGKWSGLSMMGVWEELPGWKDKVIIDVFFVTGVNPKNYPTFAQLRKEATVFTVNPVTGCPNNRLKFSDLQRQQAGPKPMALGETRRISQSQIPQPKTKK